MLTILTLNEAMEQHRPSFSRHHSGEGLYLGDVLHGTPPGGKGMRDHLADLVDDRSVDLFTERYGATMLYDIGRRCSADQELVSIGPQQIKHRMSVRAQYEGREDDAVVLQCFSNVRKRSGGTRYGHCRLSGATTTSITSVFRSLRQM